MAHLLVSEIFPPRTGGSGRWFWEIYRRLPRGRVVIAAGEDPRAAAFDRTHELRVVRTPLAMGDWGVRSMRGLRGYWRGVRNLLGIVQTAPIESLHCGRCLPEGLMALLVKQWTGIPYVCYVHGEDVTGAATSREFSWLVRQVFSGAEFVIANSRNTRRILKNEWSLSRDRVRLLYPGVDTRRFAPAARNRSVREQLGWHDRPVVLTVGRLQRRKGHDQMIQALGAIIRHAVPDVLYAIVGAGEERERLERLVEEHDLRGHVQFLGELDDDQLVNCHQQCDLFVLPNRQVGSDIEGFGMVLLEAQACGRPVVAGASGGTAETMRVPETGRIVPCESPEPLAETVIELLGDAELRQHMGLAARRWTVERFDWAALSVKALAMFEDARPGSRQVA